jgi:hypothetical protein
MKLGTGIHTCTKQPSLKMPKPSRLVRAKNDILRTFSQASQKVYSRTHITSVLAQNRRAWHLAEPASERLPVTNLERTLIDIVVRPAYAGGPSQVLKTYHAAKDRMSVDQLLAILNKLDYVYPYHQSIGFLMQKTGYPEKSCAKLRALGINYDFYLAHGLHQPEYSEDWRLFYPKDFG